MKKLLGLVFVILVIILLGFSIIRYNNPEFEFITYLSGSSTFVVAILTILYVFTTSKQLDIMTNQLAEMKKDRELQNQPLPYIENINLSIEKPRFFYTPPDDEYSFQSRYNFKASLNNLSESPAICIDISACIILPADNDKLILDSVCQRVDVLEGKCKLDEKDEINLTFVGDCNGKIFEALRSENINTFPRLKIITLYRNISGGCFTYWNEYYIIPDQDKENTMRDWHTQIVSFPTKYKDKLSELKFLRKANRDKWHNLFDNIKEEVACVIEEEVLELNISAIQGKFSIESMERDAYFSAVENNSYYRLIGVGKK